jgi:hypothetical protein
VSDVDQLLGDGLFAYWWDHERARLAVAATSQALCRLWKQARPGFRAVAHYEEAVMAGLSLGEEEWTSSRESSSKNTKKEGCFRWNAWNSVPYHLLVPPSPRLRLAGGSGAGLEE